MANISNASDSCVLVTGGAGFIGSHTVVALLEGGYRVVVVDDLSNSSEKVLERIDQIVGDEASERLSFYRADVSDRAALEAVFDDQHIDTGVLAQLQHHVVQIALDPVARHNGIGTLVDHPEPEMLQHRHAV